MTDAGVGRSLEALLEEMVGMEILAERICDHGFDDRAEDGADWVRFDNSWSALPSVEHVRAEYVRANPSEFSGG